MAYIFSVEVIIVANMDTDQRPKMSSQQTIVK